MNTQTRTGTILKNKICAFTVALYLSFWMCAIPQSTLGQGARTSKADKIVQATMEANHLPSLSVAVSNDGKIIYQKALGLADLETGRQASSATVYAQGSVTKTLTAVAALMLAEIGRLELDAPVQRYCPAFPKKQEKITVRQLLAHTAGIRHYNYRQFDKDYLNFTTYKSIPDALVKFKDDSLVASPGEKYHYSSWGYVVVACAIEGASGQPFNEFITRQILKPAGMRHSFMNKPNLEVEARATGYNLEDDGSLQVTGTMNPSDRYGASGLLSTPGDLIRFSNALLNGTYIDQNMMELMWSPQRLDSGASTEHGLGWDLVQSANAVAKGGTSYDHTSLLYIVPSKRLVIAINTNFRQWTAGRTALAIELAGIFGDAP